MKKVISKLLVATVLVSSMQVVNVEAATQVMSQEEREYYESIFYQEDTTAHVVKADNTLWGWGTNIAGTTNLGASQTADMMKPNKIADNVVQTIDNHAVKTNGDVIGWGSNESAAVGNGKLGGIETGFVTTPEVIMTDGKSVGERHIIKNDGSLWQWGTATVIPDGVEYEKQGNLWNGGIATPVHTFDDVKKVVDIQTAIYVIKEDGSLWAWGYYGMNEEKVGTPTKILDNVKDVDALTDTVYAIKEDNTLWVMGNNDYGQFGNGTYTSSDTFVKVADNVAQIDVGIPTYMLKTDGTVWAWCSDYGYELGTGNKTYDSYVNKPVKVLSDVKYITSGLDAYAIKNDGTLWVWGANAGGHAGTGTQGYISKPTKMLSDVVYSNGRYAIKKDGTLWAWGSNDSGEVGNGKGGNFKSEPLPVKVLSGIALYGKATPQIKVTVDNNPVKFDQAPVSQNGRTLVPLRAIFEALGAEVSFADNTVTGVKGDTTVRLQLGSKTMYVNDVPVELDVPAQSVNGRTLVPTRAVAQAFNAEVSYDSKTSTVVIKTN